MRRYRAKKDFTHTTSTDYIYLMSPDPSLAPYLNNTPYNIVHFHNLIGEYEPYLVVVYFTGSIIS